MAVAGGAARSPQLAPPADADAGFGLVRGLTPLRPLTDEILRHLLGAGMVTVVELPRDTVVPAGGDGVCVVAAGQISLGLFARAVLEDRAGHRQRDAALGERDGNLMPPPPMAQLARRNLALFTAGELFAPPAVPPGGDEAVVGFALTRATVVTISGAAMAAIVERAPPAERAIGAALSATAARLRAVTGVKQEILDFYLRHGLSLAGPSVRIRQLDLCIDCKQCEDACEERHGARRLTLGGFELGLLDFVFTCRTCTDARCLSPCEHDAIKRDAATGEVKIIEDKCIGCSLCALSCPYGAIDMINVAEPDAPSFNPRLKARLEKTNQLGFGPGKGRAAPARRIANKCDHCAGHADQACVSACPTGSLIELSPIELFRERPPARPPRRRLEILPTAPFVDGINVRDSGAARVRTRRLSLLLWALGLGAFVACLAEVVLRRYAPTLSASYRAWIADGLEPEIAAMNVSYLAGSKLALTCGYVGTALMVLSVAYPLQRRFGWFHRTATNQFWLEVHLMTGLVGPMFIVLHSALRLTTWVSIPFWSMAAVVLSGLLGRYLYTLVPSFSSGHDLQILEQRRAIGDAGRAYPAAAQLAKATLDHENARTSRSWRVSLLALLGWVLLDDVRRGWAHRRLRRALRRIASRPVARTLARAVDRVVFYERRKVLAPRGKALLRSWKRVHIPFSVVLLVTMVAHIVIALGVA